MTTKKTIYDAISRKLEEKHFEDILEDFDLTPEEVFYTLFKLGYIDLEILENQYELYE